MIKSLSTKVFLGSDHAGFDYKEMLKAHLVGKGYECQDMGTYSKESCDYPEFAQKVCEQVVQVDNSRGVLVCGTGIGITIAANKMKGIRAGLCHDYYTAQMCRAHNNCNVVGMGARVIGEDIAKQIVDTFMETEFDDKHPNHPRRIDKITQIEKL